MSEQKRETKDELINQILDKVFPYQYPSNLYKELLKIAYDKIRDHILTPKIKELLRTVGPKPKDCDSCKLIQRALFGEPLCCLLSNYEAFESYNICPLLTAEELKDVLDE